STMMATTPQYFSVSDQFLRGFSGIDYTKMFGEFDGPNFPKDQGRVVWIRLENGVLWPINYAPARTISPTEFTVTFGLGSVCLENRTDSVGLKGKITVFVPLNDTVELWLIELTNIGKHTKKVDIIPTVPIFGGSRSYTEYHRDVVRLYNKSIHDNKTSTIIIYPGLEWIEGCTDHSSISYFMHASSSKGKGGNYFYSDRETFLGPHYRWDCPLSLAAKIRPKFNVFGKEAVGAIEFSNVRLKPGQTLSCGVINGIALQKEKVKEYVKKYNYSGILVAKEKLNNFWQKKSKKKTIKTDDKNFDISWNKWWLYQLSMRFWFGNTGHPQFDYGMDFSGWREIWHDMMGMILLDPIEVEKYLLYTLSGIRLDGTNATRFFSRTKKFGSDEVNGLWSDHPYWTTQTVLLYIEQLGDVKSLLRDGIKYFRDIYLHRGDEKDKDWQVGTIGNARTKGGSEATGSILEHLLVQLLSMYFDVGRNNLLNIKRADWNDSVDQTRGESVTFSMGLVQDLTELADYLEKMQRLKGVNKVKIFKELTILIGSNKISKKKKIERLDSYLEIVDKDISGKKVEIKLSELMADLRKKAAIVKKQINDIAWNGKYYIGYFDGKGKPIDTVFSNKKEDFMIYLMPQAFSIISGVAESKKIDIVIDSVNKYLYDRKVGGYKLNYPPYTQFDKRIGRITGFAPGTKENNAVFNHANLFWMYAMLRLKRADDAFKVWDGINPLNHEQTEAMLPPWLPEYYVSSDNVNFSGRAEYPMLTGSAVWTRLLFERYVMGIRGESGGLRIDPCLPSQSKWKHCSMTVDFRGARYEISIKNPGHKKGAIVKRMVVDGKEIQGGVISPFKSGTHTVHVTLG
ncbi:hypothetical protein KKC91_01400, partial [bacterium]|nr:hypothetical protein [bacterium]